jgi:hypothetical protein
MKALRVTGCTDRHMWYAGKVGKLVPFIGFMEQGYKSREDKINGGYTNIVLFKDAELVEV